MFHPPPLRLLVREGLPYHLLDEGAPRLFVANAEVALAEAGEVALRKPSDVPPAAVLRFLGPPLH